VLDTTYSKLSNRIKLATLLVGACIGLIQNQTDLYKLAFNNTVALTAIALILMTLLDKLHSEICKQLGDLNNKVQANFEYHGLLDSPKERFNANEMRDVWPIIVSCVKREFMAINYLSPAAWQEGDGDNLVALLGSRMKVHKFHAKRIFVVDTPEELVEWKATLVCHKTFSIPTKYILKSDYDSIRDDYSKHDEAFKTICGFNVIDSEAPGIAVDWNYNERKTDGAKLKRGKATATEYMHFFNRVWDSIQCKVAPDA